MLLFRFCSCFPCSHFRSDLITHSCVLLTFWSVTLITDLHSMYVTHLFVICRLLAMSLLCLSSASRLLYISDVKYKYSARWGDCPSVRISSWILPANSPLFSSVSSAFWQLWPLSDLRHSVLKSSKIRGCRYWYCKGAAHTLKPSPQHLRISSTCRRQPFALISACVGVRRRNRFWHPRAIDILPWNNYITHGWSQCVVGLRACFFSLLSL